MNILHIVVDQHHANMLGCLEGSQVITPNLDRLASEGVRFTNHYTQNPICTPSRVCFHSGLHCHNHGYYALNGPTPAFPSYMHHFKAHGYKTAGIGKLHLPDNPRHWLADACDLLADSQRGPDGQRGTSAYRRYLESVDCVELDDHYAFQEQKTPLHWDARPSRIPFEHCVESWVTKTAVDFIEKLSDDDSFCMQLSYPRPHHVLTPDQRFWDMYSDDLEPPDTLYAESGHRPPNFQAMLKHCREDLPWQFEPKTYDAGARRAWRGTLALATQNDACFGMLFEALKACGRYEDTMIVFTADHGLYHGMFGIMEKAPGICSDAIGRVPSIWRVPGVEGGRVCEGFMEHVDAPATFCALAGLPPMATSDGVDQSPVLNGEAESVKDMAVTELAWSKALRWKQWRFVHYHRAMYDGADIGELYDIEADPKETRNLYAEPDYQAVVVECRRRLLEWLTETTRQVTQWPYLPEEKPAYLVKAPFKMAADGRMPNHAMPMQRLTQHRRVGEFDIVDYL